MANYYRKGCQFERDLVNEARARGCIAFRSAGSKSIIDVCAIDLKGHHIKMIQAKTGKSKMTKKKKLELESMSGVYYVEFLEVSKS